VPWGAGVGSGARTTWGGIGEEEAVILGAGDGCAVLCVEWCGAMLATGGFDGKVTPRHACGLGRG